MIKDKNIILKIQNIIDLILEEQNTYAIDKDIMLKLDDYFNYINTFDNTFISNYLSFIGIFNSFFELVINKLNAYEQDLLNHNELVENCYFTFTFDEFSEKEILIPYQEMLDYLEEMFNDKITEGIVLYMHLNSLLKKYKFMNNKIRIVDKLPVIDIDYSSRIGYFKEQYITIFRHELEEGIRDSVFLDDEEIINYLKSEIKDFKHDFVY